MFDGLGITSVAILLYIPLIFLATLLHTPRQSSSLSSRLQSRSSPVRATLIPTSSKSKHPFCGALLVSACPLTTFWHSRMFSTHLSNALWLLFWTSTSHCFRTWPAMLRFLVLWMVDG